MAPGNTSALGAKIDRPGGNRLLLGLFVALVLTSVILSPLLASGFFGDDQINSTHYAKSTIRYTGSTLFERMAEVQHAWLFGVGRLYPLSTYTCIPYYWADGEPIGFKLYVLALVLLNVALFGRLIWRVSASPTLTLAAVAALPLLFQLHTARFHDPILAFGGLLQILTALLLVSLILFFAYLRTGSAKLLLIAALAYLSTLLLYEIALVFPPLYLLIAYVHSRAEGWGGAIRRSWPFFTAAVATGGAALALRLYKGIALTTTTTDFSALIASGADPASGAYSMNFAPGAVLGTLAKQVVSTFPLSYNVLAGTLTGRTLPQELNHSLIVNSRLSLVITMGYALLLWLFFRASRSEANSEVRPRSNDTALALILGTGLLVLPNVLISLSPRYQSEVFWGVGYLPAYVSYFGTALLLAVLIRWVVRAVVRRRWFPAGFLVFAVLLAGSASIGILNLQNGAVEVELANRQVWYARSVLGMAVDLGLFSALPAGSTLLVDSPRAWDTAWTYAGLSEGRIDDVTPAADWLREHGDPETGASADDATYLLQYGADWRANGHVLLGEVAGYDLESGTISVRRPLVFVTSAGDPRADPPAPEGLHEATPVALGLRGPDFAPLATGADWALFEGRPGVVLAREVPFAAD